LCSNSNKVNVVIQIQAELVQFQYFKWSFTLFVVLLRIQFQVNRVCVQFKPHGRCVQNPGHMGEVCVKFGSKSISHFLEIYIVKSWNSCWKCLKIVCKFSQIYFSISIGSRPKWPPKRGLIVVAQKLVLQLCSNST
jgi:hypothetical protein